MNFNALIVLILTFFYSLRANDTHNTSEQIQDNGLREVNIEGKNDVNNLKIVLEQLQQDQDIVSRKVLVDNQENSILDYFNSFITKSIDLSTISEKNVYEIAHLTNIVLSCEYSEITYHYIILIDKCFSRCLTDIKNSSYDESAKLKKINECFEMYHLKILKTLLEQIPPMTLSLASLFKLTKNVVFKYHEILRILISWYAYIDQNYKIRDKEILYEQRMSRLESITITNFQMKSRLERFIVKNCYCHERFTNFKNEVDIDVSQLDEILERNDAKFKLFKYPNFENIQNKFIMNSSDTDFEKLIALLSKEVSGILQVNWEGKKEDIKQIYENYIKNCIHIRTILKFEKILVEVVYEIILWYEIKELKNLINDETILDKKHKCNNLLHEINDFIKKLKKDHQLIIFINVMSQVNHDVSKICLLMESYTSNLIKIKYDFDIIQNKLTNASRTHVSNFNSSTDMGAFLKSLSEMLVFAKLHPVISNTYVEQFGFYSFTQFEHYVINFQYLHTEYNKNPEDNFLCKKTMDASKTLERMKQQLEKCIRNDEKDNLESINDNYCFIEFNKQFDEVIIEIANITVNASSQYVKDWEKMLLTLIYNKKNIELFDPKRQVYLDDTRKQHLKSFLNIMINLFLENQYVECNCRMFSSLNVIGSCPDDLKISESESESKTWNGKITNVIHLQNSSDLYNIFKYEEHFRNISYRVKKFLDQFLFNVENNNFKLYWDGTEKQLNEVHYNYKTYTFDLQDAYDYVRFFIKWIMTIAYSRIRVIFNEFIKNKKPMGLIEWPPLSKNLLNFLKIDLLKLTTAKDFTNNLVSTINSLGNFKEPTIVVQNIQLDEFESLGFVVNSIPDMKGTLSELIDAFSIEIKQLMTVFDEKYD